MVPEKGGKVVGGTWTVSVEPVPAAEGEVTIVVRAQLRAPWHVYPLDQPISEDGGSLPTVIGLDERPGLVPVDDSFRGPRPTEALDSEEPSQIQRYHEGSVEWKRRYRIEAADRAIRLAGKRSFPCDLARWHQVRDTIYRDVFERFWNVERSAFMQHPGATTLDASALLMPLVRFISPTDPRWISTLRAIERELVSDSLVYRYRMSNAFDDGLSGQEGTFSMCSFWYVECLSRMGDLHKARFFFEKMLGYANHLGLYGEELGPQAQHLGNFPQAFTHLALISAAFDLDRRLSAAGHAG